MYMYGSKGANMGSISKTTHPMVANSVVGWRNFEFWFFSSFLVNF